MLKIFIGYDQRETVAYHVCAHSIIKNAREPVSIVPLKKEHFGFWNRKRDANQSTDFAYTRFLVPYLCDYQGLALFMDSDMIVLDDIGNLFNLSDSRYAVQVVKHDYVPRTAKKFLNQSQTRYEKKNWSSVMLFDCASCTALTPEYVQKASGLELHQFKWCPEDKVGKLPKTWNHLVGEENQCDWQDARLVHYTIGTPCFAAYANGKEANAWHYMKESMLQYDRIGECVPRETTREMA